MSNATSSIAPAYMSIAVLAATIGVDKKTIARRIASGEIPAVKVGVRRPGVRDSRLVRIPVSALEELLEPVGGC